ncbi:MAG TPA: AAA family ATPase [Saprospiraceae bacterium]|nr:ATP-binding protein [Saprospiraceae bacterium]HRW76194.1 AAA family ATPase [Saprospiraceae bacterium]
MEYKRKAFDILAKRVREPRRFIQVVTGPRQVGKTTLVRQVMEECGLDSRYGSADGASSFGDQWIRQQWEQARLYWHTHHEPVLVVLDEIQKVTNWSEVIKVFWDEDTFQKRDIRVVILGSSRLLVRQGLTESLAGRFELLEMSHWTCPEMTQAFGWEPEKFLWFGGYPGSASLIHDEGRWRDYIYHSLIETSIEKDILQLTRVDKPALLRQLFEIGSVYSGQIVAYSRMLGQLQDAGNTVTLAHYADLLHGSGLLSALPKFDPNLIRKRGSSPKWQVHNQALLTVQDQRPLTTRTQDPAIRGRYVESAVGTHLLAGRFDAQYDLSYWREGGLEVDFVLSRGDEVLAIEVKSGQYRQAVSFSSFRKRFPQARTMVIGHTGMPWEEFLSIPPESLFG